MIVQVKVALKAFQNSDVDGNGVITLDELKKLCDIMGMPIRSDEQDRLTQMDVDGSGAIDSKEWISWWVKRSSTLPNPGKQQEVIATNTFQKYDADGSGSIDLNELKQLLHDLGSDLSEKELDEAVMELDTDGNGTLDMNEFVNWWCNRCVAGRKSSGSLIALKLKRLAKKASRIFYTDIHTATWQGDAKLVSAFLKSDPRLSKASDNTEYGDNWTVLHYACYKGNVGIVQELLDCGAHVNSTNNEGFTPLFYAAQQGHIDVCQLIIERGGDPTICGITSPANNHYFADIIMSPLEHVADTPELKELLFEHPKCKSDKLTRLSDPIDSRDITTTMVTSSSGSVITISGLPDPKEISRNLFVKSWRVMILTGAVAVNGEVRMEDVYRESDDDLIGSSTSRSRINGQTVDIRIKYNSYNEHQPAIELTESSFNSSGDVSVGKGKNSWLSWAMQNELAIRIQVVTPLGTTSPWSDGVIRVAPPPAPKKKTATSTNTSVNELNVNADRKESNSTGDRTDNKGNTGDLSSKTDTMELHVISDVRNPIEPADEKSSCNASAKQLPRRPSSGAKSRPKEHKQAK